MSEPLAAWIEREYRYAAEAMSLSISPLGLIKRRAGFGQTIVPRKGSVIASPVLGAYDPDPDYFFHWYRDSALVIDALRLLYLRGVHAAVALEQFADFVHFSLSLYGLDGRALAASGWRAQVAPDCTRHVRSDGELYALHGQAVAADVRVNPDGTLDILSWARPQYDGPALRALTLLRWRRAHLPQAALQSAVTSLLRHDLAFTRRHWHEPCFDIWEEEKGWHYYTLRVAAAALDEGRAWLEELGEHAEARACGAETQRILQRLDGYWLPERGYYRSRTLESGEASSKELDIAVILSTLHAGAGGASHSVHDPRMHSSLECLEALFAAEYPINQTLDASRASAMGRYAADHYYSGGAYYFSTLAAAEFCFRAAAGRSEARRWIERGNAFLETVKAFTPPSGELAEQFDRTSGAQTSAKQLAWSYAAFISCITAREALMSAS